MRVLWSGAVVPAMTVVTAAAVARATNNGPSDTRAADSPPRPGAFPRCVRARAFEVSFNRKEQSMAILPDNRQDQIVFCENHWPVWESAPAAIGTTAAAVGALKTATETARGKFNAAQTARQASKSATQAFYEATADMRGKAASIIAAIKAFADQQADPTAVYTLAQIDPPAPPTPAAAPGKPTDLLVTLEPTGAVTLSWSAENAAASTGGFFNIARKLPGQGSFIGVGGAPGSTSASRRSFFTDFTVPTSAAGAGAQYIIQGRRGTLVGEASEAITVQFGVEGGGAGGGVFSVNGVTQPMKMAA